MNQEEKEKFPTCPQCGEKTLNPRGRFVTHVMDADPPRVCKWIDGNPEGVREVSE